VTFGDPGVQRRVHEADEIAVALFGIVRDAIAGLTDDPIERVRLLKAVVWIMAGRWLSAFGDGDRDREWDEAREAVMDVARTVRMERDGRAGGGTVQ